MTLPKQGEFTFKHSTQTDKPSMTAAQLKASFDVQGNELKTTINAIVDALEQITSTSGAGQIGSEAITNISGTTVRDQLVDFRNKLKSITAGSSGADFINAAAIAGLTGSTVQALLEALKIYADTLNTAQTGALNTHKTSSDHDGRYFTETEMQATTDGYSGADKTGATQVASGSGTTVQAIIEWLYLQISNATLGQIVDGSLTDVKLSDAAGQIKSRLTSHMADDVNHVPYVAATGTANTYAVTLSPAPTAYVDGMAIAVKINVDSTAASTLNPSGLGAKPLKKASGTDITNMKANGVYTFRYNSTTGNFILQGEGGSGNAVAAHLLAGETASTDAGDIVGTMPNNAALNVTPTGAVQNFGGGYYPGVQVNPAAYVSGQRVANALKQFNRIKEYLALVNSVSMCGISSDPSGNIYVFYQQGISKFNPSGTLLWTFTGVSAGPQRTFAVSSTGEAYFQNQSLQICKVNAAGIAGWTSSATTNVAKIALDANDDVFVQTDNTQMGTFKLDKNNGSTIWSYIPPASPAYNMRPLAVDSQHVYVNVRSLGVRKINKTTGALITPDGGTGTGITEACGTDAGVGFTPDGLYVLLGASYDGLLKVRKSDLALVEKVRQINDSTKNAYGLVVDPDGMVTMLTDSGTYVFWVDAVASPMKLINKGASLNVNMGAPTFIGALPNGDVLVAGQGITGGLGDSTSDVIVLSKYLTLP